MPGVGKVQFAGGRVEDGEQAGDEHPLWDVGHEDLVGAPGSRQGGAGRCIGAKDRTAGRHYQCRRYALVGDVADHDPEATTVEGDEVVEVASDLTGRAVVGLDLPTGQRGELARQQCLLDQ